MHPRPTPPRFNGLPTWLSLCRLGGRWFSYKIRNNSQIQGALGRPGSGIYASECSCSTTADLRLSGRQPPHPHIATPTSSPCTEDLTWGGGGGPAGSPANSSSSSGPAVGRGCAGFLPEVPDLRQFLENSRVPSLSSLGSRSLSPTTPLGPGLASGPTRSASAFLPTGDTCVPGGASAPFTVFPPSLPGEQCSWWAPHPSACILPGLSGTPVSAV